MRFYLQRPACPVNAPLPAAACVLASRSMDWQLLLMALGLALIIEGLPYFLHPEGALRTLRKLEQMDPVMVRLLGLAALISGMLVLLLGRYFGA